MKTEKTLNDNEIASTGKTLLFLEEFALGYVRTWNKYQELLSFLKKETIPYLEELRQYANSENIDCHVRHGLTTRIESTIDDLEDFLRDRGTHETA
jgi:hypothetical protein